MDAGGATWGIINIVGPLLLVIVLAFVFLKSRKTRRDTIDRSEAATRDNYDREEAARRDHDRTG
jgi:hypothetical protein